MLTSALLGRRDPLSELELLGDTQVLWVGQAGREGTGPRALVEKDGAEEVNGARW